MQKLLGFLTNKEINENMQVSEIADGGDPHGSFVTKTDVAKLLGAPTPGKEDSFDDVMEEINEAKNIFKTIIN